MTDLAPLNSFITTRDPSPESVADLFTHFTIGAPATEDPTRPRKPTKQQFKVNPRLPSVTKRRLPPNSAATQPSTRGIPPVEVHVKDTKTIVALPSAVPFTFASNKTIDFSHPIPFSKARPVEVSFTPAASSFPRAIQSLPPDILIPIIRVAESEVLKSLSLVNRALHYAIAPILYRSLCLTSLAQVWEFSRGVRHPLCISSLQMFLTPDPQRRGWTPSGQDWPKELIKTLYSLERLMSLAIKRSKNTSLYNTILSQSDNPVFLPSLQSLSFGSSHQFSKLALQRPIRSCGFTFRIKQSADYDNLKRLLTIVASSGELLRELQLVINIPQNEDRSRALHTIGQCAPGLRKLSVRFQLKGQRASRYIHPKNLARLLPPLPNLTSLELFDTAQFEGDMHGQIAGATALAKSCPSIQYVNFDGTLWKRSPPLSSSAASKGPPRLDWTPYPSSTRGSIWWGDQSHLLEAKSQQQATIMLRNWVLEYWNLEDMWEVEPRVKI